MSAGNLTSVTIPLHPEAAGGPSACSPRVGKGVVRLLSSRTTTTPPQQCNTEQEEPPKRAAPTRRSLSRMSALWPSEDLCAAPWALWSQVEVGSHRQVENSWVEGAKNVATNRAVRAANTHYSPLNTRKDLLTPRRWWGARQRVTAPQEPTRAPASRRGGRNCKGFSLAAGSASHLALLQAIGRPLGGRLTLSSCALRDSASEG